jgi:hypothetical protein
LEQGAQADDPDLMVIRELVESITVKPDKTLQIIGRLDALIPARL